MDMVSGLYLEGIGIGWDEMGDAIVWIWMDVEDSYKFG